MYADEILLLNPSVTYIQRLLHLYDNELAWLDMAISFFKIHIVYALALGVIYP